MVRVAIRVYKYYFDTEPEYIREDGGKVKVFEDKDDALEYISVERLVEKEVYDRVEIADADELLNRKCRHCGSTAGFYSKNNVKGYTKTCYKFDGSLGNNSDMYSELKTVKGSFGYCIKCNEGLGKIKDLVG